MNDRIISATIEVWTNEGSHLQLILRPSEDKKYVEAQHIINGAVYPRYLRMMNEIYDSIRKADK